MLINGQPHSRSFTSENNHSNNNNNVQFTIVINLMGVQYLFEAIIPRGALLANLVCI